MSRSSKGKPDEHKMQVLRQYELWLGVHPFTDAEARAPRRRESVRDGAEETAHLNREIQNRWALRLDVGGADLIQFAP